MSRRLPLLACALIAPFTAQANAEADFSLTLYSSATPGQIDSRQLPLYGDNLPGYAVVRDRRQMRLERGRSVVRFADVAARMDPTTVRFSSLTDPKGTRVIEQNYQYDLVSGQKLLERFIGETLTVEQTRGDGVELIEGRLLSAADGLTLQLDDGQLRTLTKWNGIRFPSLPGGLITKPTLVWDIETARAGEHSVQVAYQASGLTWWADYNAVLQRGGECRLDLAAWVSLVNQSGGSFPNAQIKLVAGDVHRAPAAPAPAMMEKRVFTVAEAADGGFRESALFEYHLYTLGRRSDLPASSTKQLELFPAVSALPCQKQLVFNAAPAQATYWGSPNLDQGYAATSEGRVSAFLKFANRSEHGLGIAMPAGRVRVNQAAEDGSLEFIGEDVIGHTPRNETLEIKLGEAFDIVGERRQTDFRVDSAGRWMEEAFEVSVRNRKTTAERVLVRETLYRWSGWKLLQHSHGPIERDARTLDFPLDLPADSEVKLNYRVRYQW